MLLVQGLHSEYKESTYIYKHTESCAEAWVILLSSEMVLSSPMAAYYHHWYTQDPCFIYRHIFYAISLLHALIMKTPITKISSFFRFVYFYFFIFIFKLILWVNDICSIHWLFNWVLLINNSILSHKKCWQLTRVHVFITHIIRYDWSGHQQFEKAECKSCTIRKQFTCF